MSSRWVPANEGHAIERVTFSIAFGDPLSSKLLAKLQTEVQQRAAAQGLNQAVRMQPMVQVVQTNGPFQVQPPPASSSFRKVADGLVLQEAIVGPDNFAFSSTIYTSWAELFPLMEGCLQEASEVVLAYSEISDIRLEYWDRFDARTDLDSGAETLIDADSVLISPFLNQRNDSWHSHIGYFMLPNGGRRKLINLNVDVVSAFPGLNPVFPSGLVSQARIYTMLSDQVLPGGPSFESWKDISATANGHHTHLKSLLGNLINKELVSRINLNAEPFAPPL